MKDKKIIGRLKYFDKKHSIKSKNFDKDLIVKFSYKDDLSFVGLRIRNKKVKKSRKTNLYRQVDLYITKKRFLFIFNYFDVHLKTQLTKKTGSKLKRIYRTRNYNKALDILNKFYNQYIIKLNEKY